jgi:hypothetical protein
MSKRGVYMNEHKFIESLQDALEFSNGYSAVNYSYDYWVMHREFLRLVWHNLTHKKKLAGNGLPTKPEYFAFTEFEDELPKWKAKLIRTLLGKKADKFYITTREETS